jgi:ABC-type multidrug transport system fused ATPase/permease subunit
VGINFKQSVIGQSFQFMARLDKLKILAVSILQTLLSLLDLLAVGLIGMLGALSVSGVQSRQPGNRVSNLLKLMQIDGYSFQTQAFVLGVGAIVILVSKTVISISFTRRTLRFLSHRSAELSSSLIDRILAQPFLKIQNRAAQETVYAVTTGVSTLTVGVIGTCVLLISDSVLLIVMAVALLVVDPIMAIMTILLFGFIAFAIYILLSSRAKRIGALNATLSIEASVKIVEVLTSFREIFVRNRRGYYVDLITTNRRELAAVNAERSFMPYISKYVIESSVLIGAIVIAAIQFYLHDAYHAVATLSIFLAAGTRIAPAILRIQQGALQVRTDAASVTKTLELIDSLRDQSPLPYTPEIDDSEDCRFTPHIVAKDLSFKYPNSEDYAVKSLNLEVLPGKVLAIVGPSGSGKTTLGDLILGLLKPTIGTIYVSGEEPEVALSKWPGSIAYVPQDITISQGTIRGNVSMGFPINSVNDEIVWKALEIAQLADFVEGLPGKLDTDIGERGIRISGGQRQRLGIARAMYTDPKLLLLDEATSALDGQTEHELSESIKLLKGKVTVVIIAHRLSTVRTADTLVYLEGGKTPILGDFEHVRRTVPEFDNQARLMGL